MLEIVIKYNQSTDMGCWMLAALFIRNCGYTTKELIVALNKLKGLGVV